MFAPLFRKSEQKENEEQLDNLKRMLYNSGRNRGITLSRANRQLQHTSQIKVSRGTIKVEVNQDDNTSTI